MNGKIIFFVVLSSLAIINGQNVTCTDYDDCFDCFKYTPNNACGYCAGESSRNRGCFPADSRTTVCNGEDDSWYAGAGQCPDGCNSHDKNSCENCLEGTQCVWCMNGGRCRSGNDEGPWFNFTSCSTWRYIGKYTNRTEHQMCSTWKPCNEQPDCETCTNTYQDIETQCTWCGSSNSCVVRDGNLTSCGPNEVSYLDPKQCPQTGFALRSVSIPILFTIATLLASSL
eukprot:TRINITY_DN10979_c0_g1_i1.p1 TRINITY_DN10979_c0_g1~~TRINITY_DN10979_c0_g1_i1.p1  ORF type:complete len:227 (-),score=-5.64 TRINITY_DN10979_c0_g1_i1:185-865(-)